ncbi:uncharacterized protein LOC111361947 [Spodoptera litura]|uniref:Uncharacterized protein LOC111361947 n=1 Tax=Spodoptera litura TaxID=69820 RepID=A0A9J7ESL1_SPOLT|nr:uncharacterized protein LOC111361947 [Spodoptera litura]
MKSLLLVVLLAAAASAAIVSQDIAEVPEAVVTYESIMYSDDAEVAEVEAGSRSVEIESRRILNLGNIGNSRLLAKSNHVRRGKPNVTYVQNVTFRTGSHLITAIHITHIGPMQGSRASIIAGGLNRNFVTIKLQSARGRGYNFRIRIYGR